MHSPRRNALAALTILGLLASFLLAAGTPAAASALPGEPPPPHGQDPTTGKLAADRLPLGMEPDRGSALPPPIHVASAGSEQARVPGDEYWVEGFGPPGMDRSVDALVVGPGGTLYAGGFFTTVGSLVAYHIARWDGVSWHPNGAGMNAPVLALAMGPDGSLYAGGAFTTAGGTAANHIARWDAPTSSWHSLGSGIGGDRSYVVALAFGPDGSLYAGGWFTTAGGTPASHIARWDGTTWHPLGSGIEGDFSSVNALAVGLDGSLYAGGWFTTAGGVAANSIARWDAPTSSWYPLGTGMGEDYSPVNALAVGLDGSLYAGGWFTTAGGVAANHIARWDGASWHPLGSGVELQRQNPRGWPGRLSVRRGRVHYGRRGRS